MRFPRAALLVSIPPLLLAAACDTDDGRQLRQPTESQRVAATNAAASTTTVAGSAAATAPPTVAGPFLLTAPWVEGAAINARFTCDGRDVSPALSWTAPPAGTVELALVMSDDNVGFIHWALTGLPAAAGSLPEGTVPAGVIEATNDFGDPGWGGPCPPEGETHTYRFQLHALTGPAGVEPGIGAREMVTAIEANSSTVATATGTYGRA